MNACTYARVSTAQQVDGISLKLQDERLRAYAIAQGWELVESYEDAGESGASTDRPAYQRMMSDAANGRFDVILVYRFDRLTRSVRDFHELADNLDALGVGLVSVTQNVDTTSPTGRLLRNILIDFANFERELTAGKTRDAKRHEASLGRYLGWAPPLGYRKVGTRREARMEVVPDESEVVRRIFSLYLTGEYGVNPIARDVGLSANRVRRILLNPTYTGKIAYAKRRGRSKHVSSATMDDWIITDGEHDAIISEADFQKAQRVRESNTKRRGPMGTTHHLFSRMVYCGQCGTLCRMVSTPRTDGARYYQYYRCDRRDRPHDCDQSAARHEAIERVFLECLERITKKDSHWKAFDAEVAAASEDEPSASKETDRLQTRRTQVVRRIDRLVDSLADGELIGIIRPRLAKLEEERQEIDRQIRAIQREAEEFAPVSAMEVRSIMRGVLGQWDAATVPEKREGVRILVDRFVVKGRWLTIHWTDRHMAPTRGKMPDTWAKNL